MIKALFLVIALIAGIILGPEIAGNQGYVLISAANQTIEMSLITLIIGILLVFALLFLLEFLVRSLFNVSSSTRGWFSIRNNQRARALTNKGLLKLIEGDWKQAEKQLLKGAKHSGTPLLNYLAAAEAAQNRNDIENRDLYLQRATDLGHDTLVITLTRAKLQYRQGQYEEALASLQGILEENPHNEILLDLLKNTYQQLEDWQSILRLLPALKRIKSISKSEINTLEITAECGVMKYIAVQKGKEGLLAHWSNLSRAARQETQLIACLVKQLIARQADAEAYTVLRENLNKHPDESLICLMPELSLHDYHSAIVKLQDLLRHNQDNSVTHSALGQLYFREQKWGQAREHFEKALKIRPDVTDYARLVNTLEKLNDPIAANDISREALKLALPHKA